ncbi:hypothetical protein SNEBB_007718 [Seison nebaliae]|nr:hypothetical protein SNEBB_007718 [Seison nebaliae]
MESVEMNKIESLSKAHTITNDGLLFIEAAQTELDCESLNFESQTLDDLIIQMDDMHTSNESFDASLNSDEVTEIDLTSKHIGLKKKCGKNSKTKRLERLFYMFNSWRILCSIKKKINKHHRLFQENDFKSKTLKKGFIEYEEELVRSNNGQFTTFHIDSSEVEYLYEFMKNNIINT